VTETPNPNIVDSDTLTGEMHPIRRGVLALGSNVGERFKNLQGAVSTLADTPEVVVVGVSPVYETRPVGGPEGQRDFLNAVVAIDTTLSAHTLLERCLAVEDAYGREREELHGPRTLDVDLIVLGERLADDEELELPHPRAHERAFVLKPWSDIEPEAEIPGQGRIADLLGKLDLDGIRLREDADLELS
jgi:2-amino-4-hydroxy-6-hydroxymethyldihydropteridine diphosphokinase